MRLPEELQNAIEKELEKVDRTRLSQASAQLTERYKSGRVSSPVLNNDAHRAAYLALRVPATYAANLHVFSEVHRLAPEAGISSILDVGAGPGTALYAASQIFPSIQQATLVEADASLITLGKRLGGQSSHAIIRDTSWIQADIQANSAWDPHDLVVISYALGELPQAAAEELVRQAWVAARKFLAIIEPGTVRGFGYIHAARMLLIGSGAHLVCPCPHAVECPMAAAGDWCHFAARVERTSLHRQLKGGTLGYEDEKFSYVVAGREPVAAPETRIVRHPQKLSGHVKLLLCTSHGLENRTITKSQKEQYRDARKAGWGDGWPVGSSKEWKSLSLENNDSSDSESGDR